MLSYKQSNKTDDNNMPTDGQFLKKNRDKQQRADPGIFKRRGMLFYYIQRGAENFTLKKIVKNRGACTRCAPSKSTTEVG